MIGTRSRRFISALIDQDMRDMPLRFHRRAAKSSADEAESLAQSVRGFLLNTGVTKTGLL